MVAIVEIVLERIRSAPCGRKEASLCDSEGSIVTGVVDLPSNRAGRNILKSRSPVRAFRAAPSKRFDLTLHCGGVRSTFCSRSSAASKKKFEDAPRHEEGAETEQMEGHRQRGLRSVLCATFRTTQGNLQPDEEPLVEATGAGLKWLFSGLGNEPMQVQVVTGGVV